MKRVIIETPYAAPTAEGREFNLRYLRACMHDSLMRGEAPFASHALYTQPGVLRDEVPEQREHGIKAGFAWRDSAHKTVVYTDLGISRGMQYGIDAATRLVEDQIGQNEGHSIEYRTLGEQWLANKALAFATDNWVAEVCV